MPAGRLVVERLHGYTIPSEISSQSQLGYFMNGFGEKLRRLREEKGLTQVQLAELSGLSQNGISNWEKGMREPSWLNVVALCLALGVDCGAFMEGGGPPAERAKGKRK